MVDVDNAKLWDVCEDIYIELYKHSTPKADFLSLIKQGEAKDYGWWERYKIERGVRDNIIFTFLAYWKIKKSLTLNEMRDIYDEITHGCCPSID